MATSCSFDDGKINTNGATVSKTVTQNDMDKRTDSEKVGSAFCTHCLHPGIKVACENSGTPDANSNNLVKTNPEPRKWVIDTVKDRFMKVVQEQEMVQVNILDPNSQDDEYRHIVQALQEYTQTIDEVAQCMYDVIREEGLPSLDDQMMVRMGREGVEIEAMRATNKLIRIHKALLESSHSALKIAEEDGAASRALLRKNGRRKVRCYPSGIEDDSDTRAIIETTREHSETLGNIVLTLITELINKYRLPANLMARLEDRIVQQHEEDLAEKVNQMKKLKKIKQKEAGNVVRNKKARKKDRRAIYKQLAIEEAKKSESGNQVEVKISQESLKGSGGAELVQVNCGEQNGSGGIVDQVDEVKSKEDETKDDWGNDRAFQEKFCAVLQEKFSYKFSHVDVEQEINTGGETQNESVATSEEKKEPITESALVRMNASCAKRQSRNWKKTAMFQQTNEMFIVNFYTLSTAFINELHSIKHEALERRKETTMRDLHNRLQKMKDEMARVEDEVAAELAAELKLRTRLILEGNMDASM